MAAVKCLLRYLTWIIFTRMVLCEDNWMRNTDSLIGSLLDRVNALEGSDTKQQQLNIKIKTDLGLQIKLNAELRNDLHQHKHMNIALQEKLDEQEQLIAELQKEITNRDGVYREMNEKLQSELVKKEMAVLGDRRLWKLLHKSGNSQKCAVLHKEMRNVSTDQKGRRESESVQPQVRQVETEATVAFTAGLSKVLTNLGMNQNIIFDWVEINTGNGYNPHHGIFVAPVSGTYVFYTAVYASHDYGHKVIHCRIVVNGLRKNSIYAESATGASNTGSQMLITKLKQGDDVAVQVVSIVSNVLGVPADIFSTFSGFLLKQDLSDTVIG